ncbi:MAG: hypothetical protein AAGJ46_02700 [Planctomycetota bacterium]
MRSSILTAVLLSICVTPAAFAQFGQPQFGQPGFGQAAPNALVPNQFTNWHPSHPYPQPTYPNTAPNAIHRHSSTAIEGYLRGVASVRRAYTDGMLSLAQARILFAQARAYELQLRVINTATNLERRQMLQERRDAERLYKQERKAQAVALRKEREANDLYLAYKLRPSMLNRLTGEINWPDSLIAAGLEDEMQDIELLFAQLANDGAQYDRLYRDPIVDSLDEMRRHLLSVRGEAGLEFDEYIDAQKFLIGLKYEAENWGVGGRNARLAANF